MIFGKLTAQRTAPDGVLSPIIYRAINQLMDMAPETLSCGQYELEGKDIFVNVMVFNLSVSADKQAEQHAEYIDVQILLSGEEQIEFGHPFSGVQQTDLNSEEDYLLCDLQTPVQTLTLQPQMFVVFFPGEPHKPGLCLAETSEIKKAVIKIHRRLLA